MNKDKSKSKKSTLYTVLMYVSVLAVPVAFYFSKKEETGGQKLEQKISRSNHQAIQPENSQSSAKNNLVDANSAAAKFKQLLIANADYEAIQQAMLKWLEEDEAAALSYMMEGELRYYLIERDLDPISLGNVVGDYLFEKYGGEGSVAALEAYEYNAPLIRKTYERVIENWAIADQESLKSWWYESPMVNYFETVERLITAQFLNNDPIEAIKFHEGLPDDDNRKELSMSTAYVTFVDTNEDTAVEYLADLAPTKYANDAHWRLAFNASSKKNVDVATAVSWVDRIYKDEAVKYPALVESLATYAIDRPEDYENWLEQTSYFEDNGIPREMAIENIQAYAESKVENRKTQAENATNPDSPYYVPPTEETTLEEL